MSALEESFGWGSLFRDTHLVDANFGGNSEQIGQFDFPGITYRRSDGNRERMSVSVVAGPRNHFCHDVPVQVLGELFNVLVRKGGKSRSDARDALQSWRDTFPVVETSPEVMVAAADLATDHQLGIWDAVTLSAASQSDCRLLLSEDLQEGFTWAGVTVVDPFRSPQQALLHALLGEDDE